MMMQLLAEASTIDAGAVGQIISTLVGAGAIGGGGYVMGKARKISLSNDPLNVRKANEYATKEDIARLEREIRDIKNDRKEDLGDIYDRLNEQGRDLHEIIGMLKTPPPPNKKQPDPPKSDWPSCGTWPMSPPDCCAVKMTYAAGCSCKWCRPRPARKLKPN